MKKFILILLTAVILSACATGPVLGPPTLLQQALNSLPAISVAGTSLQFQFGGETWIAKLNGANFSGGTVKQIPTDGGFLLALKQTHMSPSAIPGAAAMPGVNWVAMAGPDIVFEYKAGPPMAIRLLSKEEIAERLGDTGADGIASSGDSGSSGAVTALAPVSGDLPDNLLKLDDAVKRAARGVEQALPQGTVIAVFNVTSSSQAFSKYVIDELTGELVNGRKVVFVDRRNLEFAVREMNIQVSGDIADERMQGLGRLLGARSVVSGTLTSMGGYYRFRIRVMNVETLALQAQVSLDLQNDSQVAHLLGGSPTRVATASTATTPATASSATTSSATAMPQQPAQYKIGGKGPAGGIVFYDKGSFSDGWRYMEVARKDLKKTDWGLDGEDVVDTKTDIGSGKKNTEIIVAALNAKGETGKAAQLCKAYTLKGYSDWFLPSKDELDLVYTNTILRKDLWYWSSSQQNKDDAWNQSFARVGRGGRGQHGSFKTSTYSVRAVRQF